MATFRFPWLIVILPLIFRPIIAQTDTITADEVLRDGETLVSASGKFALGFFSPGNSSNRYVGIWFNNITETTIVWVANRQFPLTESSGIFKLVLPGILILQTSANATVWSSNSPTAAAASPTALLLDSGNLVISAGGEDDDFLWQSFDYPTDTYLPGMDLGWNLITKKEIYLTSWKSVDDPAIGEFSYHLDPTGYPQLLLKRGSDVLTRIGPWNGFRFPGPPNPKEDPTYKLTFVMDEERVIYRSDSVDASFISRYALNQNGVARRWTWVDRTRGWVIYFSLPSDICDTYRLCGAYGSCDVAGSPSCRCLDEERFVARDREGWVRADWSDGCVRRKNLSCDGSDVFVRYSGIKLPDARDSWHDSSLTLVECREECLRNCSCMAYTQLDIKRKIGCLIWYHDLIDIRTMSQDGQVFYVRMAASEAEADSGDGKKREILIASLVSVLGVVVLVLALSLYVWRRKMKNYKTPIGEGKSEDQSDLPFWELSVILKATNHFSSTNKLGEGGFGLVYKGKLEGGQDIAVKRLSKESRQGLEELKNEVILISKLQHRNLVKLLGCCIQGDESMLIYQYLPNKSLDLILFDETKSRSLDWQKRFHIINGIARGLLYLHQDSPLRIIHRDLKASNILLDSEMNPKISDFGLARSFGGNETEAQTRRVVGTFGYMSPEYAVDGLFSVKSDVFSFGVLALEIVSGKKNRGFAHTDHRLNLLGHAWTLYQEGRLAELVDTFLNGEFEYAEVEKSIKVGLLCVQQNPEDRPKMSTVVWMLGKEGEIPEAKHPGFFTERQLVSGEAVASTNDVTITIPHPR
ncbi:G-type lectin S-receptor-like serine/threonine-protein kinase At4g27290 [Salvia splendens]|nr:G-type lectin S-receptor-like serine/threonine-protein kinase At4g27290 [Salvia splendens]